MSAKKQVSTTSSNLKDIIKNQTADFTPSSLKVSAKAKSKSPVS